MEHLESQLPALERTLSADVLDRIDEIVPPGTNVNPTERGWDPPWLTDAAAAQALEPGARMRIFSGIQPTGRKHLGNYIGAIAQYVSSQERGEGIFCIVDLHAITVAYDPGELRERLYDTTAILLAAGLDPARCILFRQSDVHEHTELTWLLSSVTELGRLQRMHQFRDKSIAQRELVSAGLLLYPVLQAADVLAYRAEEVPVGEDQREHLELMRDVARRFNARFGDGERGAGRARAPHPAGRRADHGPAGPDAQDVDDRRHRAGHRVRARRAEGDREEVQERRHRLRQRGAPRRRRSRASANLIEILAAVRGVDPPAVEAEFAEARYGDFKTAVAAAVIDYLAPVRERYEQLRDDEDALEAILADGAARARAIAGQTLADVRERMGVGDPRRARAIR